MGIWSDGDLLTPANLNDKSGIYDMLIAIEGKPGASEVLYKFVAPRALELPSSFSGSQFNADTAATSAATISITKNGAAFGTATVVASATTAAFSSAGTTFAAGDILRVVAPATQDATLADFALVLKGSLA